MGLFPSLEEAEIRPVFLSALEVPGGSGEEDRGAIVILRNVGRQIGANVL